MKSVCGAQTTPKSACPTGGTERTRAYQSAFKLRNQHAVLRRGSFKVLATKAAAQLLVFERRLEDKQLIILINRGNEDATMASAFFDDLKLLYATDPEASNQRLPRLSAMVFGTAKD
ncbi:MAG: DUF3459 domain-containing protein [Lentimonas sp.]